MSKFLDLDGLSYFASKIKKQIADYKLVYTAQQSYKCTSTSLQDTGVSYTTDDYGVYRITATIRYNQSPTTAVSIYCRDSQTAITNSMGDNISVSTTTTFVAVTGSVIKVYGQWQNANTTNGVVLIVEKLFTPFG